MRTLNILVADDDEQNQALLKLILENLGHHLKSVWNGVEAVTAVKTGNFDLVFMDVQMPEMDGLEAIKQIRRWEKNKKHTPIAILTASLPAQQIAEYKKAGADTYILKPFSLSRVSVLVNMIGNETDGALPGESRTQNEKPIAELPILDIQNSLPRFNNDKQFYLGNLNEFVQSLPTRLEKMNCALKIRNWNELSIYAHNLKGVAANFGAEQLHLMASKLEVSSQQGKIRLTGRTYRELIQNIDQLVDTANKILELEEPTNSE